MFSSINDRLKATVEKNPEPELIVSTGRLPRGRVETAVPVLSAGTGMWNHDRECRSQDVSSEYLFSANVSVIMLSGGRQILEPSTKCGCVREHLAIEKH